MTNRDAVPSDAGNLVFIEPNSGFEIRAISPSERSSVEAIIAGSTPAAQSAAMLETLALIPDPQVFGGFQHGVMVATYALRREGMTNDLALIVVVPGERKRGIGRTLLQDALRRSGKRPLAAQTPDTELGFFKACGFKLVGRRVQPNGDIHFRVGWHAPGARFKGGTSGTLTHTPLDPSSEPTS
jgi:hypothetical protein